MDPAGLKSGGGATARPPEQEPRLPRNPSEVYATPEELAADEGLSLEERAALLEHWEADDEALVRAEGEGMGGGERPELARVARVLALVRRRLAQGEEGET